jgi:hypothetical protein
MVTTSLTEQEQVRTWHWHLEDSPAISQWSENGKLSCYLRIWFWQVHLAHFGGLIWPTLSH